MEIDLNLGIDLVNLEEKVTQKMMVILKHWGLLMLIPMLRVRWKPTGLSMPI